MTRLSLERMENTPRRPTRSGEPCESSGCRGRLTVYSTIVSVTAGVRTRYLACDVCGSKPANNKQIVPLDYAPPRKREEARG